jgi:hypothetical protein
MPHICQVYPHASETGDLTTSKRLLNNRKPYPPFMLVSVVTDALSCVAAWQLMTGALRKICVEKLARILFASLWCERDG